MDSFILYCKYFLKKIKQNVFLSKKKIRIQNNIKYNCILKIITCKFYILKSVFYKIKHEKRKHKTRLYLNCFKGVCTNGFLVKNSFEKNELSKLKKRMPQCGLKLCRRGGGYLILKRTVYTFKKVCEKSISFVPVTFPCKQNSSYLTFIFQQEDELFRNFKHNAFQFILGTCECNNVRRFFVTYAW